MVMLKATLCGRKQPSVLRSSGSSTMPAAIASRGLAGRALGAVRARMSAQAAAIGADQRAQQLGAAGAGHAADAEDLAGADVEIDVVEHARPRQAAHAEHLVARPAVARGIDVGELAADHHADQRRRVDLADHARADHRAVAQHGDAVADAEHLLQPVRDVDEADALRRRGGG